MKACSSTFLSPFLLSAALVAGCTSSAGGGDDDDGMNEPTPAADARANNGPDAMPGSPDAMAALNRIPTWTLEDVNPESPTYQQTIGLGEFSGKILVATLVDSF